MASPAPNDGPSEPTKCNPKPSQRKLNIGGAASSDIEMSDPEPATKAKKPAKAKKNPLAEKPKAKTATAPSAPAAHSSGMASGAPKKRKVTIEISDDNDNDNDNSDPSPARNLLEPRARYAHRLSFPHQAATNCAVEHAEFKNSSAHIYHYLALQDIGYTEDGKIEKCRIECSFCGDSFKGWQYNKQAQKSTSNYIKHMERQHERTWKALVEKDLLELGEAPTGMDGQATLPNMFHAVSS